MREHHSTFLFPKLIWDTSLARKIIVICTWFSSAARYHLENVDILGTQMISRTPCSNYICSSLIPRWQYLKSVTISRKCDICKGQRLLFFWKSELHRTRETKGQYRDKKPESKFSKFWDILANICTCIPDFQKLCSFSILLS